jgi:DNA invertase Pin-like site-specific DNA recombinase
MNAGDREAVEAPGGVDGGDGRSRPEAPQVSPETSRLRVVGYVRVSTAEQADSGLGLEAQRTAIREAAERRGWELVTLLEDRGQSGKSMKGREALHAAIALVEAGGAEALVAAKLDRVSRSIHDFSGLLDRAARGGWKIAVLDMDLDMTTPQGEMVAHVLMSFAQFERRLIGARTRDALAVKKAAGATLGRPSGVRPAVVDRMRRERADGLTLQAIAGGLDADGIPTAQGGAVWHASTVRAVLARAKRDSAGGETADKLAGIEAEAGGEADERVDGDVSLAPLDRGHVGPVEVGGLGESLDR